MFVLLFDGFCNYSSTKAVPYVYVCIHRETNEFYIGYRRSNKLPSNEDFPLYKTSSKLINPNFDEYNYFIIAEFFNSDDAYDFEQRLIYENWDNPLLLDKSCFFNKKRFRNTKGYKQKKKSFRSVESNLKRSNTLKGRPTGRKGIPMSEEQKKKLSEISKGKKNAGSFGNRPPWNKGIKMTEEQKSKQNTEGLKKGRGWNKGLTSKGDE